ncbi:hypothetical protein GCM10028806_47190 [Spirosoma terrae]
MASNDMNSWGEDPDELLRQRWQQTFAEFEVQSRPSVRRRIFGQLTAQNQPKSTTWLVGIVLLLLFSFVLVYTIRRSDRSASVQSSSANVQLTSPTHTERATARRPTIPAKHATSLDKFETVPRVNGILAEQRLMNHQPIISNTESDVAKGQSKRHGTPTNRFRLRAKSNLPLTDFYRPGRPFVESAPFSGTRSPITLPPVVGISNRQGVADLVEHVDKAASDSTVENHVLSSRPATSFSPLIFAQLQVRALSALPSSIRTLPNRLPVEELVILSAAGAEHPSRQYNQWFVEAVPLSSFQWMSTSSTSTAYLTQVNAPAAFSPATWGYQINGGVRWQHWQAYLSIGQLRRWAYYTVNENRYRMESTPSNSYQMVREKHVVAENVALSMIGGGISQYRLLGQGRYMVELGSQVLYSPTSGQTLASLRGGVGRRLPLPVSQLFELQTGLMAEYGLTRLMSEQQQLIIHPIVVGISIRVQPRLPQRK